MEQAVIVMKRCSICEKSKPITEFYPAKDRPDGRQNKCKSCESAYSIMRTLRKEGLVPSTYEPYGGRRYGCRGVDSITAFTKLCTQCNRIKPLTDFGRKYDGYNSACKECRREARLNRLNRYTKEGIPNVN